MQCSSFSGRLVAAVFALLAVGVLGEALLWVFFHAPSAGVERVGSLIWYFFALFSGFLAAGLPFALPFILLFTPVFKKEGLVAGTSALLAVSLGMLLSLTAIGVASAWAGKTGMDLLPEGIHLRDWISIFSGIFIYVLALGEIGLLHFRVFSYGTSAPAFIRKRQMLVGAFFLGMFLGTIGIGSVSPAVPLLLIESASSGNVLFGAVLFAAHALGRIVLLFLFALVLAYGVDGVHWLSKHGTRITRANGWLLLGVSSMLMTLGVFSHGWWEASRLHEFLAETSIPPLLHPGIFGLPFVYGSFFFAALMLIPLWWQYAREHRRVYGTPAMEMQKLFREIDAMEKNRRHLEVIAHLPDGEHGAHILRIESEIDALETKRRILEDAMRYGAKSGLRDEAAQHYEEEGLRLRRGLYLAVTVLVLLFAAVFL